MPKRGQCKFWIRCHQEQNSLRKPTRNQKTWYVFSMLSTHIPRVNSHIVCLILLNLLQLKGMQLHMEVAYRHGARKVDTWKDFNITTWTVQVIKNIPQQKDRYCTQHLKPHIQYSQQKKNINNPYDCSMSCGLFSVKNMEKFTGDNLDGAYTAVRCPHLF